MDRPDCVLIGKLVVEGSKIDNITTVQEGSEHRKGKQPPNLLPPHDQLKKKGGKSTESRYYVCMLVEVNCYVTLHCCLWVGIRMAWLLLQNDP